MAYFDSIKIGGTIKQVQVVQELNALPSPVLETSPQLVKIGNDLYMKESKMGGLYGTYRFMLVPTNQQVYSVAFVSNGQTFGEITINASGEMLYNSTLVYSNGSWVNDNYKTIAIFDGNFTNALASFLNNNTEKIIDGYFKYIKVSSEGGAANIIYKEFDNESAEFALKDGFTDEELETLLNDKNAIVCITGDGGATYFIFTQTFSVDYLDNPDMNIQQVVLTSGIDQGSLGFATVVLTISYQGGDITTQMIVQAPATAPTVVNLNDSVPSTATQGTLTADTLTILQASNENYIVFNDEIFRLADKQHNAGYLVYSHNGHDTTGCFFQKCITITLSTRGWVLETQENQAKLTAGSNITIENNVISASGGGGGSNDLVIDLPSSSLEEVFPSEAFFGAVLLGVLDDSLVSSTQTFTFEFVDVSIDADIYNEILNNDITTIRFRLDAGEGNFIISPLYFLNMDYPLLMDGSNVVKGFSYVPCIRRTLPTQVVSYQTFITISSTTENTLTIIVYAVIAKNS